MINIIQCWC